MPQARAIGYSLSARARDADVPIVASSGLQTGEALLRAGLIQAFLPKPYTAEALLAVLAVALRSKSK